MKTENNNHMIDYLETKILKMEKTAKNLQKRIKNESKELSTDQIKGLQSLEKSTVNAIKEDKKDLYHLKIKEKEDT
jgi:hypothetical protein